MEEQLHAATSGAPVQRSESLLSSLIVPNVSALVYIRRPHLDAPVVAAIRSAIELLASKENSPERIDLHTCATTTPTPFTGPSLFTPFTGSFMGYSNSTSPRG